MGAKRDPNFFQWYLRRFWRYPAGFNINAKYDKGQITCSCLFIFKMYESHRNKALIMSLFFAHFAYSHCQMQSLQQQVSDTPIFTASTYAYYSRCSLQSDMSLKVMNSVVGWRLAKRRITQIVVVEFVVTEFLLTSASRGPSAIVEFLVQLLARGRHCTAKLAMQ